VGECPLVFTRFSEDAAEEVASLPPVGVAGRSPVVVGVAGWSIPALLVVPEHSPWGMRASSWTHSLSSPHSLSVSVGNPWEETDIRDIPTG
jgi:hypothetical protein